MREYLFHGKSKETGEWVEGYYACESNHACFQSELKHKHYIFRDEFMDWNLGGLASYEVIPESVGQYTGMKDKNGRKIFEGDIVRCQKRFDRPYSDKRKSKRHIGVVKYQVRGSHFDYAAEWIVEVEDYGKFVHGAWGDFYDCEVIGNVFENADLLEG